jgi:molybdopterin synthase catalytic subunit
MAHVHTAISEGPLDVNAAIAEASGPECGGIGVFVGTVRESAAVAGHESKAVVALDYEAHPALAPQRLGAIAEAAATRWSLPRVVAWHRTGHCDLGEPTVVVACGAPHRGYALEACRWLIDELKATVPIWKREIYSDGSSWVGAEGAEEVGSERAAHAQGATD